MNIEKIRYSSKRASKHSFSKPELFKIAAENNILLPSSVNGKQKIIDFILDVENKYRVTVMNLTGSCICSCEFNGIPSMKDIISKLPNTDQYHNTFLNQETGAKICNISRSNYDTVLMHLINTDFSESEFNNISQSISRGNFDYLTTSYRHIAFSEKVERVKNNQELMLAAVGKYGTSLKDASESLRDDYDLVLAAVKNHGCSLQYASQSLQNNPDIVRAAIENHPACFKFASESIQNDREFVVSAVRNTPRLFRYLSQDLQDDHEINAIANQ